MNGAWDTIKVSAAGFLGFITQMSNLDLLFKCIIGLLTIGYLCTKIWDWIEGRIAKRKAKQ